MKPTWNIMICSIPHRDVQMCALLAELDAQMVPGVGVLCSRDDLKMSYGGKMNGMLHYSTADYVCAIDDDDFIAGDYIARITQALASWPDYVGFKVLYTVDGIRSNEDIHSLAYHGWENQNGILTRDIGHQNPMRREIALTGTWDGANGGSADYAWASGVRASGQCRTQVFIDDEMYHYRCTSGGGYNAHRTPVGVPLPPLPDYPWLTVLDPAAL